MSTFRSVLDELRACEVERLSDDELHEEIVELERASRVLEAERARRVCEADHRRSYVIDGHLSMTAWLRHRLGIAGSAAAGLVRMGRALGSMPGAREAFADGQISTAALSLLIGARDADPEQYDGAEETLVDLSQTLPVRDLQSVLERWRLLADAAHEDAAAERRFQRRRLHVSPTLDGMVRVDGDLDAETGQTVVSALRSLQDGWTRSSETDTRSPAQRRADALGEICRRYLDSSDRPSIAGERPHVTVTLDLAALEGRAGRRCDLDDAGRITPEAARRIACDAAVGRLIIGPRSEPLDVGRRTPVVPPRFGARRHRPRWRLSVPRMRSSAGLVRRAPRRSLGRRRLDVACQPRAPLPAAPPTGPPTLPHRGGRRGIRLPSVRRDDAR